MASAIVCTMLLPAIGFVIGCIVFTLLGLVILRLVPGFRLSRTNIILFVVGAFPGSLVCNEVYGRLFADSNDELKTGWVVVGYFAALLVGAASSGSLLVWLKLRFLKPNRTAAP